MTAADALGDLLQTAAMGDGMVKRLGEYLKNQRR